ANKPLSALRRGTACASGGPSMDPVPIVPGQTLTVRVVRPGDRPRQAIGFLSDGTWVVVEEGVFCLDHEGTIEVNRVLETGPGRMVFGSPAPHWAAGRQGRREMDS